MVDGYGDAAHQWKRRRDRERLLPRWTCNELTTGVPGQNKRCWGHFPGDVNGNLMNQTSDLEALIIYLNAPPALYLCDMDYSGNCMSSDIIEWIDMANGGGAFGTWLNTTLVPCPSLVP